MCGSIGSSALDVKRAIAHAPLRLLCQRVDTQEVSHYALRANVLKGGAMKEDFLGGLATKLRSARKAHGWSREDLMFELRLATGVKVSHGTLVGWEGGKHMPSLDTLARVADVLELDLRDLVVVGSSGPSGAPAAGYTAAVTSKAVRSGRSKGQVSPTRV